MWFYRIFLPPTIFNTDSLNICNKDIIKLQSKKTKRKKKEKDIIKLRQKYRWLLCVMSGSAKNKVNVPVFLSNN